ncbi:cysteine desulfurase family protein [Thermoflavimicrobium daqui]|uniref:Cysteine desulfurase NifS n=1 Tax=Thermoflavimicrobium daqui TaxID=2137476 RepID=A0A364K6H3_9BACL|nr:cysteine desulfurase family protein [Thermoflavimicrobium daqui]RAL25911.1 cysteine desulfurase NifS [Thermoflavimicrobium daqui]
MIYLDNSATTQTHPDVISVMTDVMQNLYGNPSSLHKEGVKAERLMEQARKVIAKKLNCHPAEIIFTSGGTEANNLAIKGVAEQLQHRGRHLITSKIEHPSVYDVMRQLEQRGWKVTYLDVDQWGHISVESVEKALTKETVLVSIMHVNNELGTIQPIAEIGQLLAKYPKVLFHVDAIQSFGKLQLAIDMAQVDLLSISAHKFHGPKGIGALYVKKNIQLAPLLVGGGQEQGLRSGTQNVPGIVGMAKATMLTDRHPDFLQRSYEWKKAFLDNVTRNLDHILINGDTTTEKAVPYIINLSFPGLKSEVLVHALENEGVMVSTKSACSSKLEVPSRVLKAIGRKDQEALSSIRISMGYQTKQEEMEQLAQVLLQVVPKLQQVMKVR